MANPTTIEGARETVRSHSTPTHTVLENADLQQRFLADMEPHRALLFKVCRLYAHTDWDREDLFQEIIIQCWKAYPTFRQESKFSTWIYRIALNTALMGLRKKKLPVSAMDQMDISERVPDTPYDPVYEERLHRLYEGLKQLSEVERALVMLYLDDRSYEDMEEILGISQGALRTKMSRCKDKLRIIIQKL